HDVTLLRGQQKSGEGESTARLTLIVALFLVLQNGEGDGSVDRCHAESLQVPVRVWEAVGIAGLVHDLGVHTSHAVPEWLLRREPRAVVGAIGGEVPLIDADTQVSEERVRVDGRREGSGLVVAILR